MVESKQPKSPIRDQNAIYQRSLDTRMRGHYSTTARLRILDPTPFLHYSMDLSFEFVSFLLQVCQLIQHLLTH